MTNQDEIFFDRGYEYDTVGMRPENYAELDVKKVDVPPTPDLNYHDLVVNAPGVTKQDKWDYLHARLKLLKPEELELLKHKWSFWARHNQIPSQGNWTYWLQLAGRGFGKTRSGAEWVNEMIQKGRSKRMSLVAPTAADVRKVMVEGESGILAISPPWNRPTYEPSKLQLVWPNGAIAQMFSAEEPERLRGPQCDAFWADELAAWKKLTETWDMLQFGFRLGDNPQGIITTTPKPVPLVKDLLKNEESGEVLVTRGTTYENKANLAPKFYASTIKKYEGTRLGRQELEAAILEDMPGALWQRADIDKKRIPLQLNFPPPLVENVSTGEVDKKSAKELKSVASTITQAVPEDLTRIVVAVDPNVSNDPNSDEIGIVVAGIGMSGQGYVLADASMKGSPNDWATTAIMCCDAFDADRIIGEANQGGNMVENTIKTAAKFMSMGGDRFSDFVPVVLVHATRGKVTRAEPSAALYEQGRVSHVGTMRILEDQMCLFTSNFDRKSMGYSPDRVDALVWALTHLFVEGADDGLIDFMKQEVMKQAERNKEPDASDFVKMVVPVGVNRVSGRTGDFYFVDSDGNISAKPEDVGFLLNAGCTVSP